MHDAEPAARYLYVYVVRPGGLEAGSIPARISLTSPSVISRSFAPRSTHYHPSFKSLEVGMRGVGGFFCVMCARLLPT